MLYQIKVMLVEGGETGKRKKGGHSKGWLTGIKIKWIDYGKQKFEFI